MSKAERTRQFIIEKTAPLFNSKGYAGTSLSDIEKATGLTKGSIYGNFTNKDDIALAAFRYNITIVTASIKSRVEAESGSINKLLVYPRTYRNFLKSPFLKGGCPILNTSTEADDTHPKLRRTVSTVVSSWKRSLETIIIEGIANKEIKKDVNPETIATLIIAITEGAVMMAKLDNNQAPLHVAMDHLENLIEGIKT